MHAVAVVVGHDGCHKVCQFFVCGFFVVHAGCLSAFVLLDGVENFHEGAVFAFGVHGNFIEGGDAVARASRHTLLLRVDAFYDEHTSTLGNQTV